MLLTYGLIIVPTVLFILNIAVRLSVIVVIITVLTATVLLVAFTTAACSDPGVVFVPIDGIQCRENEGRSIIPLSEPEAKIHFETNPGDPHSSSSDIEEGQLPASHNGGDEVSFSSVSVPSHDGEPLTENMASASIRGSRNGVQNGILDDEESDDYPHVNYDAPSVNVNSPNSSVRLPDAPPMIECSRCKLDRPRTASHCYQCNVCVDGLDHHCPWTGKCIGRKNISFFYGFLWALNVHVLLVFGGFLYAITTGVKVFEMNSAP